jgi:hypothetical protein
LEKMLATYVHPLAESGRQLHLASWDHAYSQPLPEVGVDSGYTSWDDLHYISLVIATCAELENLSSPAFWIENPVPKHPIL